MLTLTVNGNKVAYDGDPTMPLLWFLRDVQRLTGTKFGCGIAQCGACTVHLGAQPIRSCITPVADAVNDNITTIEAIGETPLGKKVQDAWLKLEVVHTKLPFSRTRPWSP
jgi:isoquinoline 1-oxidoreductase subunit alpha